ncbi:unnamed protein product [Rotaria sordida]|uniref:Uncharacterized protein n=1 Tax=Rotaria sordida TaxID=392033 RepID=A0A819UNN5_9BILA|nr:unnamed protein product [Rotaria sordida]CAF4099998.1 unnamed protein product [Rotaria sordida]
MALSRTHRIIWLDAFIGQDGECHSFKRMFCTVLDPNSQYGNELDIFICALNANAVPFIFVDTIEKAIHEIKINNDKQIIFISSGSLGQRIIPSISSTYPNVYSFYLFCGLMTNYVGFALDYLGCLQIFVSELDLLVRLARDISREMIKQGERHLIENDPEGALNYFELSRTLELTVNEKDKLNSPFLNHLRLLNGYGDEIGLIQQAENLKEQQDQERDEQQPEPLLPKHDSQGQIQGLIYQNIDLPVAEQILQEEEPELMGQNPDLPVAEQVSLWKQKEEMDQNSDLPIVEEVLLIEQ